MTPIRVALLCDQPLVRTTAGALLAQQEEIELVSELPAYHIQSTLIPSPNVVLLAVDRVELSAEEILHTLEDLFPNAKIVLLLDLDKDFNLAWLSAGQFAGCLYTEELNESLVHIVRTVAAGETVFGRSVIEKMTTSRVVDFDYAAYDLTEREWAVLKLMARGATNTEIAASLHLSPQTVRNKVSKIYGKIGVDSRSALLLWAQQRRIFWA